MTGETVRAFSTIGSASTAPQATACLTSAPALLQAIPFVFSKVRSRKIAGADIDPIVLRNGELERSFLIEGGTIPVADCYFDVIFSDFVLEHVENPGEFLREIRRLLRPGGKYFFRTPNRYHYVTLISALTPHGFHKRVANPVRGLAGDAHGPWPTFYRMNTRKTLERLAAEHGFERLELRMIEADPSYLCFHALPFLAGVAYERLVNSTDLLQDLRVNILGCFTNPAQPT